MPRAGRYLPAALLLLLLVLSLGLANRLPGLAVLLAASSFLGWALWLARGAAGPRSPAGGDGGEP